MKRFLLALVLSMLAGWAIPAASAAASPPRSTWHRLNPDQSNPAPEHERLRCKKAAVWVCRPWFSSFRGALRANPFPLPFNGVDWPSSDCMFAP